MSFKNKVVFITGATSEIGKAVIKCFVKEGAQTCIIGRCMDKLKTVEQMFLDYGPKPYSIKADLTTEDEVVNAIKQTVEKFKKLNVLVNIASVTRLATLGEEDYLPTFDEVIDINLRAKIHLCMVAAPHLAETKGNIINMSSTLSTRIIKMFTAFSISCAGLDQFTKAAAIELGPLGVRVNSINPGPVKHYGKWTDDENLEKSLWQELTNITVLRRLSEPEEIADLILFLASDKAVGITGVSVICDNGANLKFEN